MKIILLSLIRVVTTFYYFITLLRRNKALKTIIFSVVSVITFLLIILGGEATLTILIIASQVLLGFVFMIVQFLGLFWFLSRTKAIEILPGDPKMITWNDYWGNEHIVRVVKQWQKLLSGENKFKEMGGKPIRGILLIGPPGAGKTMLAKAMAGDAGIAFYGQEGSSFTSMFFGVGVLKIMSFFRKGRQLAKQYGACILFLDEIDAIGRSRGALGAQNQPGFAGGIFGGLGSMGLLTRLLYEMDGIDEIPLFDQCENKIRRFLGIEEINPGTIMVLGATNIPEVLDPALTRPGRFDRKIYVDLPDKKSRRAIIEGYLSQIKHDPDIDIEELVQITPHVTPAQISAAITKDAVRIAFFDGRNTVTQRDIEDALEEQVLGIPNPIADFDPEQRRQVAIHEAGHAIVQHFVRPDERIVRVSIIRRGGALGYMLPVSKVDLYTLPLDTFIRDIMVSLAGHVATELVLGKAWTGAGGDLMAVRSRIMILASHGLFGSFPIDPSGKIEYSPKTRELVDEFLQDCLTKTKKVLIDHRKALDALVEALLEKDDLLGREVVEIIEEAERKK